MVIDYTSETIKQDRIRVLRTFGGQDEDKDSWVTKRLNEIIQFVNILARGQQNRFIDYINIPIPTASETVTLPHNFNGPVSWWLINQAPSAPGTYYPMIEDNGASDVNNLVLNVSYFDGTIGIRVQEQ